MALIKCPHCGGVISDKAVKCPHCGNSLGKATIIQYGSKAEAVQRKSRISPAAMTSKIFFLAAILASVVPCVIQFIKNNGFDWLKYSYFEEGSVLFGHYLASNQLAAIEMAAALLSIILAVCGIIKLCKSEVSSWKFWLLSTIVAWLPVLVIFLLQVDIRTLDSEDYDDLYSDVYKEKVEKIEGTYRCQLTDGTIISFSIVSDSNGYGFLEFKSLDGTTKADSCFLSSVPS